MAEYIVVAPNGKEVTIDVGTYADRTFLHKAVITDEEIAKQYPQIFKPYVSKVNRVEEVVVEKLAEEDDKKTMEEEVEEVEEPKKQMLTEVPVMEKLAEEDDKPTINEPEILLEKKSKTKAKRKTKK